MKPLLIFWTPALQNAAVFLLLIACAVYLFYRIQQSRSKRHHICGGGCSGCPLKGTTCQTTSRRHKRPPLSTTSQRN